MYFFQGLGDAVGGAAYVVYAGKIRRLFQQVARDAEVFVGAVLAFAQPHYVDGWEEFIEQVEKTHFQFIVGAVAKTAREHGHVDDSWADAAAERVVGGEYRGPVWKTDVGRTPRRGYYRT